MDKTETANMSNTSSSREKAGKSFYVQLGIALLFPAVLCFFYCIFRGETVFSLYAPNSDNNDSLMYYKIAKSLMGGAKGLFGYDENRALIGVGGYWSPVLYIPWVIWGKLFGWDYSSYFGCNLFVVTTAFTSFIYLVRPKWEQFIWILMLIALYPSFTIYTMSVFPEILIASVVIVFIGLVLAEPEIEKKFEKFLFPGMYICILFLTLARPYYILLAVFPARAMLRRKKRYAIWLNVLISGCFVSLYFLISHFFSTPYFFSFSLIELIKLVFQGEKEYALQRFSSTYKVLWGWINSSLRMGFLEGYAVGIQYILFCMMVLFSFIQTIKSKTKTRKETLIIYGCVSLVAFAALLLLTPKAFEISRHLFTFVLIGCFLLAVGESGMKSSILKTILLSFLLIFLIRGSLVNAEYDVPFFDSELSNKISYWEKESEKMLLPEASGADNSLIWTVDFGTDETFKELYALPAEIGISCCHLDYAKDNISTLKSGFIAVAVGGEMEYLCEEAGFEEVGRTSDLIIYKRP